MDWVSILIISLASLIGLVFVTLILNKAINSGTTIKGGKDGISIEANIPELERADDPNTRVVDPKDYADMDYQAYIASTIIIRKVQSKITLLTEKETYKQQMNFAESKLKDLITIIDSNFNTWLDRGTFKGDTYFKLQQENKKFLRVIEDYLHLQIRNAIFQNGYSDYSPELFETHVEVKTKEWLNSIGTKRRAFTEYTEQVEEYLTYADSQYKTYHRIFSNIFEHTALIHKSIKKEVRCLERFIQKHKEAFKHGTILEFEEGCMDMD